MIKVLVVGAAGRMGREVVKAVHNDAETDLAAAVGRGLVGADIGEVAGVGNLGLPLTSDLAAAIASSEADVAVEFSLPESVRENVHALVHAGIAPVVGTTGLNTDDLNALDALGREARVPIFVVPNFAIGAVLMMRFAAEASKYFDSAEIIEYHHDKKLDAPSGTAFKTALVMHEARGEDFVHVGGDTPETGSAAPGARGGNMGGVAIHSVRLAGYLAHQEVIFGMAGQTLNIRHDTITRECYMPGVLRAVKAVRSLPPGLTYGLEKIL